jgi:hypothetical protein
MSKAEDFIKQKLSERSEEIFNKNFGQLGNKENSDNLSGFFVEKILPELGYPDASDLFADGYTDGGNELGIDVLIKVGTNVHIIQTKYVGFNSTLSRDKIDEFQGILIRLNNPKLRNKVNKRLNELLEDVDWKLDSFHFWFVTNINITNQALLATANEIVIPDEFKKNYDLGLDRVNYSYIDQKAIYEQLAISSSDEKKQGIDSVELFAAKQTGTGRSSIIEISENSYMSAILVVESEQIARWCRGVENKTRLFDFNIRNYLGESQKNKKILETAKSAPEKFFLYNNGLSAVCEKMIIDHKTNSIKADRFSIINGAQTARSLARLNGSFTQPKVMLRVTEIPNHKDRNEFLKTVVRFNNTQNEIKTSDFRSNDLIQKSFIDNFSQITKGGKKCIYTPKRTDISNRNSIKIDMTEFAKAIFNYSFNTYELVGSGATILFDSNKPDSSNSYYNQIFGKEDGSIPKDLFEYKAGIYFLSVFLNQWMLEQKMSLRNLNTEESKLILDAIERKNILLWLMHKFFMRLQKEVPEKFDEPSYLRKIGTSKNELSLTTKNDKMVLFLLASFEAVKSFAASEYRRLRDDNYTHRQWVRGTEEIIKKLQSSIRDTPFLTSEVKQYL